MLQAHAKKKCAAAQLYAKVPIEPVIKKNGEK